MKVLVTGAAGYIGSQLVPLLLNAGYDVFCMDRFFFGEESLLPVRDKIKVIKDDIRWFDPDILNGVDAVLDLASLSNDPSGELDQKKTFDINYRGRVRVATLAKKHGVKRYILASTCSVYGYSDKVLDESSSLNPLTTYAKANMLAEKEILALADNAFCSTALRQATVYGFSRRMRFDLAINGMVLSFFKHGKVKVMRDGSQWRPFIHVKDTSRAFIKMLESDKDLVNGKVYNAGSDEQNYQILNLARMIAEAVNLPFDYEWYGSPDTRNYRVSFRKIAKELNFKAMYTPSDGAREIYESLKNGELNPDDPRHITVEWYKKLLSDRELASKVMLRGVII